MSYRGFCLLNAAVFMFLMFLHRNDVQAAIYHVGCIYLASQWFLDGDEEEEEEEEEVAK